jgi:hypothetical protein
VVENGVGENYNRMQSCEAIEGNTSKKRKFEKPRDDIIESQQFNVVELGAVRQVNGKAKGKRGPG